MDKFEEQICRVLVCLPVNSTCVSIYRRRPHQGECGGHHRVTVGWRCGRGRVQLQQTEASLLHQSNNRTGAQGAVGGRHGDVRVLVLGRVHPAGQADLQAVWRPLHPHLVRHHLELPLLPALLHRPPVQKSREADAQTEIQVRGLSLHHNNTTMQVDIIALFKAEVREWYRKKKRGGGR